ncbi:thiopeptide-type bacteriocin biosynthesis protein [Paenibacillus polymyxa]|uniref:lantibiotic dehydratase n=1 Tax=Paenibacillus polymyxa TaxID=1406 RepID=UPI00278E55BC|nr:lantibiotic dehydratase [Paenibacillus polymyxa]MDQ0049003.1 thiopeptide-type bacteriocin biosynthesis protein [Paenibacillus polymyxa]
MKGIRHRNENRNLFRALDFFLVRIPLLPVEMYNELFYEPSYENLRNKLLHMVKEPIVCEALLIASPSLMHSVNQILDNSNSKKADKIIKAIAHYMIRLSTRATPYGVFAGVAMGSFESESRLVIGDLSFHRKIARPDMQWLMDLVKGLERIRHVVEQVEVRTNSILYTSGSRVKLPYLNYIDHFDSSDEMKSSSIRISKFVDYVIHCAKQPVPILKLMDKMKEEFPTINQEQLFGLLLKLVEQEFLISNLRPPLSIRNSELPFEYIKGQLASMTGIDDLKASIQKIYNYIQQYNQTSVGEGEELYTNICSSINEMFPSKDPLQIDMETAITNATLSHEIAEEVAVAAEVLWRLSNNVCNPHLATYRGAFIEKYGVHRQIPLLELLDEDMGLGAPPDYKYPMSKRSWEKSAANADRDKHLARWVAEAIKQGSIEIELTDEKIRKIECAPSELSPPPSLEMYVTVATSDATALEGGDYKLIVNPNSGGTGAGKTFGRFGPILDGSAQKQISSIYKIQSDQNPNVIFAELIYLTINSRHSNVVITNRSCSHQIILGTNDYTDDRASTISLADLYVGCTHDSFYLMSRSLNKRVIPVATNMLNYYKAPNVYRFLREMEQEGQRNVSMFQWGNHLSELPFLPRIRYGNTILSLASWSLNADMKAFQNCHTKSDWRNAFERLKKEWSIPRYVYITIADNRLLIDTTHDFCISELYDKYQKLTDSASIWLTECGFEWSEVWGESTKGHHIAEYVIPLVKTNKVGQSRSKDLIQPDMMQNPISTRSMDVYFPGSEWLYVKLYGMSEREEEFIGNYLRPFCELAEKQKIVDQHFIIRYKDPDDHVRVRFHGDAAMLCAQLIPAIQTWANKLKKEGLLNQLVYDTYEQEVERYGGGSFIQLAEEVFAADSKLASEFIYLHYNKKWNMPLEDIALISVIDMLNQWMPSLAKQVEWSQQKEWHNHHIKEFQKNRTWYMSICDVSDRWSSLRACNYGEFMIERFQPRREKLKQYKERFFQKKKETCWDGPLLDFMESFIHMHLNRLLGTDRMKEAKIMSLLSHALYHLNHAQKYTKRMNYKEC